jgi:hypothetical protein
MTVRSLSPFKQTVDVANSAAKFTANLRGLTTAQAATLNTATFKNFVANFNKTPLTYTTLIVQNPQWFTKFLGRMNADDLKGIYANLTDTAKTNFLSKADPSVVAKLDIDDATVTSARQGGATGTDVPMRNPDGTIKSVKYGSPEFWSTVRSGGYVVAGFGLLSWIDEKFEDSEEEYKNCMAGCLPHNWDAYDQGNLDASDLQYSNVTSLEEYQITPVPGQPYCASPNEECEDYCKPKCEELSEVDIPLWDSPLNPFDPDSPLNPIKWLERLLSAFNLDFIDPTLISSVSVASSSLIFMLIVMTTLAK